MPTIQLSNNLRNQRQWPAKVLERLRRILGSTHEDVKGFENLSYEKPREEQKAGLLKLLKKHDHAYENRAERRIELGIDNQELDLKENILGYTKMIKGLSKGLVKPFDGFVNFLQNDS